MHASGAHLANVKIVKFQFGEFAKARWFYVQRQLFYIDKTIQPNIAVLHKLAKLALHLRNSPNQHSSPSVKYCNAQKICTRQILNKLPLLIRFTVRSMSARPTRCCPTWCRSWQPGSSSSPPSCPRPTLARSRSSSSTSPSSSSSPRNSSYILTFIWYVC